MDIYKESLKFHEKKRGKISVNFKGKLRDKHDLSIAYTPGVAEPCRRISRNKEDAYRYTIKGNSIAVVTDGSAVLGLGNIGALAGLPVMEGKAVLFKEFAGIDAYPICIETQEADKIIEIVKNIAPGFGGINLEDISAPRCFEVEEALQNIGIPVFHDDQHGTAVVVLAALMNACKVIKKDMKNLRIAVSGAGAAGIAISKMLLKKNVKELLLVDTKGIVYFGRENSNRYKDEIAKLGNKNNKQGTLADAIKGADVFIGVSAPNIADEKMIRGMNRDAIVFAMSNPIPEIMPDLAKRAGAKIVGTGRSDFPNQINNVLAFPGIFRGALDAKALRITEGMKIAAAEALANYVRKPTMERILPSPLDRRVAAKIAKAVAKQAISEKVVR